jgi:hypothetical protein
VKSPLGLRVGETFGEKGKRLLRAWQLGMLAGPGSEVFNVVLGCRLYLSLTELSEVVLLHLSFENVHSERLPGLFYFPVHPHYREPTWTDRANWNGYIGLEIMDAEGVRLSPAFAPDSPVRFVASEPVRAALEPGEFVTFTLKFIRASEGNWHLPLVQVLGGQTYRLRWDYMGVPSNTVEWDAP